MKKILFAASLLLFGLWIAGCNQNESPSAVIEEEKYIDLMVELQLFRAYIQKAPVDSATVDSLRNEIYSKYNVTPSQFKESHEFYQQQYVEQKERIDKAIEQLRMDQVKSDSTRPWEQ